MLLNMDRASRVMDENGLDALIATTAENVYYLSGVRTLAQAMFPRDAQVYCVARREKLSQGVVVVPKVDADTALSRLEGVTVVVYGRFYRELAQGVSLSPLEAGLKALVIDQEAKADALEALVAVIEDSGLASKTIGMDERAINPPYPDMLKKRLPKLTIRPAASIFKRIRMVKTPEEIRRLRESARIAEVATLRAVGIAKEGVTEREMACEFEKAILDNGARLNFTCLHFGRNIPFLEAEPWDTPLHKGDLIWFDGGCFYQGYASDICRVFALGDPGKRAFQLYEALLQGEDRGAEIVEPGVKAQEVFHASVNAVREAGIPGYQRTHVGHGVGLEPYDLPNLNPGDTTVLEQGMVVNIELPYYEIGWGGFNPEDTLLVTEGRPEFLTLNSRKLEVVD